ncbi:unnamed protein product, partial [marine sediment metagenome]
ARYFDWQGMAREEFFNKVVPEPNFLLKENIKLVTIEAQIKYFKEALLFDEVQIEAIPCSVKITTFELLFKFVKVSNNELIAEGRQKIGFTKNNKVIRIPIEILKSGREYI